MIALRRELHVAFAGGGTGGHLYPVLSLADAVRREVPAARFSFFATERAIDGRLIGRWYDERTDRMVFQRVRPLPRSVSGIFGFARGWRASVRRCGEAFAEHRPDVVIGSGGYGSAPAICVARKMGIPCVLLNPDAVPGKANRFLAGKADVVFAQWPVTELSFPRTARVLVAGCPIRREFGTADRQGGVRRFGLSEARRTLLVTGASQGARSINRAMAAIAGELAGIDGWQVLHLAGPEDVEFVQSAYAARSAPSVVLDYSDYMADALAAADLVVTRAGASTLAEITARAVPSVILPYPYHRDKHQYANAAVLAEANAAVMVEDRLEVELNAPRLAVVLKKLMFDGEALSKMSRNAGALSAPDAAREITGMVLALVGRDPGDEPNSERLLQQTGDWRENGARDDEDRGAGTSVEAAA